MSAPKSPAEVGRGMERYDVRVGNDPLPRENSNVNVVHCFDRGHHRTLSAPLLNNVQTDANGDYVMMRGKRIEMQSGISAAGVVLPVGFVAVPEQDILEHFSTRYGRNIRKIHRTLVNYHKECVQWIRDRAAGTNYGRPRRPTIRSLNLDTPTEFERFLSPLRSFHMQRLQMAFARLVKDAEDGQTTVFTNLNVLSLPDPPNAAPTDQAAVARWNAAFGRYIAVRIDNFNNFVAPNPPAFPNLQIPFPNPPPGFVPPPAPAPAAPGGPTPMQIDENMIELVRAGRSTKWRGQFIFMEPWRAPVPAFNPFVSPQYRQAFTVAQNGFLQRYADFKNLMEQKRRAHARAWREYSAYRNEMKSVFMLDTKRLPVNGDFAGRERPQIEQFAKEWQHFCFGLKQEMKNYVFVPVTVAVGATPGFVTTYAAFAPVQPYANISQSVLQSARRMFLI